MASVPVIGTDEETLTLADVKASVGRAPLPPEEETGAIYYSNEEFLAALEAGADEPVDE